LPSSDLWQTERRTAFAGQPLEGSSAEHLTAATALGSRCATPKAVPTRDGFVTINPARTTRADPRAKRPEHGRTDVSKSLSVFSLLCAFYRLSTRTRKQPDIRSLVDSWGVTRRLG
jgi:hypothetical protein